MRRMAPWVRQMTMTVSCLVSLVLTVGVSVASANTLIMPNRQALRAQSVVVWGNTTLANGTSTFQFDFGDGSPLAAFAAVTDRTYIAANHTYNDLGGLSQKTFNAKLTACPNVGPCEMASVDITVFDEALLSNAASRGVKINMAIEDGLRYLYFSQINRTTGLDTNQTRWISGGVTDHSMAITSLIVAAYQNHGYQVPNDQSAPVGIYPNLVQKGLNFLFDNLVIRTLAVEPHGPPDVLGGAAVVRDDDPCVGVPNDADKCKGLFPSVGNDGYGTSIAALAVLGSNAPNRLVGVGLGIRNNDGGVQPDFFVAGKTYKEVAQRQINTILFAGADSAFNRGGVRYGVDDNQSDASSVAWLVLALLDAEAFGLTVPNYPKTELNFWITNATNNADANTSLSLGYTSTEVSTGRAGILLQALKFMGVAGNDTRVTKTLNYISNRWNGEVASEFANCNFVTSTAAINASLQPGSPPGSVNNKGCSYYMFQIFKALRLYNIDTLPGVNRPANVLGKPRVGVEDDWYEDYRDYLVANQHLPTDPTRGEWASGQMWFSCCSTTIPAITALAELILAPVALVTPSALALTPATSTNPINTQHTLTATATTAGGGPVPGASVIFKVTEGPNAGLTSSPITTNDAGKAVFQYSSSKLGTDKIQASIGNLLSNVAQKIWVSRPPDIVVSTGNPTKVGDTLSVPLNLRNNGGATANNLRITKVTVTAPPTYIGPALPVNKGNLAAGAITTELLSMDLHGVASGSTVKFVVNGTYQDANGKTFNYGSTRYVKVP